MLRENMLFYIIFLAQIILISYYLPEKLLGRMRQVLERYPPDSYPKLYPKSIEYYRMGQWLFKMLSRTILGFGIAILYLMVTAADPSRFAEDGHMSEFWPAMFGMIQFLPLALLAVAEFGHFRLMRQAHSATTRKAELSPRRLFDIVSPRLFAIAASLFVATIVFDLYVHDFVVSWGHDTVQRALWLTMANVFLAGTVAFHLYGRKVDPHQGSGDRIRKIAANASVLLCISMAISIFFMTQAADDMYDLAFVDATLMSLYFQVIALLSIGQVLRSLKPEHFNFEVYRGTTSTT